MIYCLFLFMTLCPCKIYIYIYMYDFVVNWWLRIVVVIIFLNDFAGNFYERLLVNGWLGWNLVYGKFCLGFNILKIIDPLVNLIINFGFAQRAPLMVKMGKWASGRQNLHTMNDDYTCTFIIDADISICELWKILSF